MLSLIGCWQYPFLHSTDFTKNTAHHTINLHPNYLILHIVCRPNIVESLPANLLSRLRRFRFANRPQFTQMAMNEASPLSTDHPERAGRRRPFTTWVKKLANFKNASSSTTGGRNGHSKREAGFKGSKKRPSKNNNPYPQSGRINVAPQSPHSDPSLSTSRAGVSSNQSLNRSRDSIPSSADGIAPRTTRANSTAPTLSTERHSIHAPSHMASSVAGTSRTAGGGFDTRRGGDSTFSSPAPSVRSLTTTLTTIQSMAPNGGTNGVNTIGVHSSHQNTQTIQFSQPFPTNSPASAIPPHLAPHGHPTTYNSATANNLLTDNASILTLASSSKRRRRRSMDTDASSLPLSVLSANMDGMREIPPTPGLHQSTSRLAGNERASIYSTTGIAPALPGERNSLYAGKQSMGDGASIRSGFPGHGRADSISGSVAGVNSPLSSPKEVSEKGPVEEKDENRTLKEKEKEAE
ncbi:hypothetical protein GQX73_g4115 [Xylaria multiplex]|uniref:Uncharacterized protein n=1 Tax=Xylaria multiplex TaxID=323545 RepID=A0A7C8MN93_9PEZI|nr:hypothetical protein GQX73_g4115 [Xylaria multiplex]